MLFVEVDLHPDAGGLQFCVQGLGLAAHLSFVLAPPDRDDDGLGRRDPGRQSEAPVVAVDQDQTPDSARGKPPRGLVRIDPVLVLVEERDVEGAGEILPEVVAGRGLQGAAVAHQPLAGVSLDRPSETLRLALRAGEDGYRHRLVEAVAVDPEHPQGLLARLIGRRMDGVTLLPEELRGPEKRAGDLLPAQHVAPLVYEDGQVAVALDPVLVESADDALGGRTDGEPFFQLFPAPYGYPRELGVEALDVLGLLLKVALGDEQREVSVPVARRLEAVVQVALDALPDLEPVGPNGERPPHGPVVGELGHAHELQIPPARVLALLDQLLDRFFHPDAPLCKHVSLSARLARLRQASLVSTSAYQLVVFTHGRLLVLSQAQSLGMVLSFDVSAKLCPLLA